MKKNKLHTNNFPFYWLIAFALAFALGSCSSTKNLDKSSASTEEERTIDSSSYWKQKHDELKIEAEQEQKELHSSLQFHEENTSGISQAHDQVKDLLAQKELSADSINHRLKVIFDSLKNNPCKSELKTNSDGSFTATGLRSADLDAMILNSKLIITNTQLQEERIKNFKLEEELRTARSEKHVVKETRILTSWWMWYLGGCLTMILLAVWLKWKHSKKEILNN